MTDPTPGPWAWCYDGGGTWSIGQAEDPQEMRVATIDGPHAMTRGGAFEVCSANAALIAAAPDLLAALKDAVAALGGFHSDNVPDSVRDAIAKAEGRDVL